VNFPFCAAAATLSLFAAAATLAEAVPNKNAKSLAAAEIAFAQESVARGTRTAFLHALSEDGIVFQPGPQNGRKAWEAEKESAAVLQWKPVLAVVAASGDFGHCQQRRSRVRVGALQR
jgi:hypothetical protein